MQLMTERLFLACLTSSQLQASLQDITTLERELGIRMDPAVFDANVVRAIGIKLARMAQQPVEDHPWLTYWLIAEKGRQQGIGFVGFKGVPDSAGEAEIGYGLAPPYRGQGFATEAVGALCRWAFSQPSLRAVTATTVTNPGSNRVLEKLGAEVVRCEGGSTDWKIRR